MIATYHSGFAPRDGTPRYPSLWRGCVGAWCPSLGPTGTVLRDWSGRQNHGALTNFTLDTAWAQGSLVFDGTDDFVSLGTSAFFSPANISFSAWVKASGSPVLYDGIIGRSTNTAWQDGWGMFWQSSSEVRFFVGKYDVNYATKTGVSPNQWSHVCGTWDGSVVRMFVNGSIGTNGTQAGSQTGTTQQLDIGRLVTNTYNFGGYIDDARIYDRALSQTEISILARRPRIAYELAPRSRSSSQAAATGNRRRRYLIGCS